MLLIKHANLYAPAAMGQQDILIGQGKILAIEKHIEAHAIFEVWDAEGKIVTPGLIDQHVHIAGAGGTAGFATQTPNISIESLIACGTTTAVGLLATDGVTRSMEALYAKAKALDEEGMTAYILTSNFAVQPMTLMGSIERDMVFIDKVLGCKIAISDVRSDYPTVLELLRHARQVRGGGMLRKKKGILHLHVGNLESQLDFLFELVQQHKFPIEHISPTHVGRTQSLFEQAIEFAKLGGIIDITTGDIDDRPQFGNFNSLLKERLCPSYMRRTYMPYGNSVLRYQHKKHV